MILDNGLNFEAVAGLAITSTANSTNVIDLAAPRDMGDAPQGGELRIVITVTQAFVSAGGATMRIEAQGAPETVLGNDTAGTYRTYAATDLLLSADLVLGAQIELAMPVVNPDAGPNPRFLRLAYTVATSTFSAGKIYAGIVGLTDTNIKGGQYAAGFSVPN